MYKWYVELFKLMKINVTDAALVLLLVTRARSEWWMEKQNFSVMIIVMDLATASQRVRREQSSLLSVRQRHTTKKPIKENMKNRAAQGKNGKPAVSEMAVGAVASEHVAPQAGAASQPTGGCPGSRMRMLRQQAEKEDVLAGEINFVKAPASQLAQWPCQIKLVPTNAPYFNGAKLLIAADCTAYAYANMHQEFMRGKVTIIGCPKLDDIDYSEKLTTIIRDNDIKEVTIVRMEVPCCGGLEMAAKKAIQESGKFIPWQVVTISIDGKKLD